MSVKKIAVVITGTCLLAGHLAAKPSEAKILFKGRNFPETVYVTKVDETKIYWSGGPSGKDERGYPKELIEQLTFVEPEGWKQARQAELSGEYAEAAKLYKQIAFDYRKVATLEDNYSSIARLNQLECLRKLGHYKQIAKVRPLLKKSGLSEKYHAQVDLFVGWGTLATLETPAHLKQMERLVNDFREAKLLPGQLAQAFYLSGVVNEKSGRPGKALTDYHRVFTLDFGTDRDLAKAAMESALKLYAAEHKIHKDRQRLEEAHGLAKIYMSVFGDVPSEAAQFAQPLPEETEEEDEG